MPEPLPPDFASTLAQKLRDEQLVLFAGAGLSMQAVSCDGSGRRMPSWSEFLAAIGDRFGLNANNFRMDRLTVLDAVQQRHGRPALNDAVRRIIDDDAFQPGPAHATLSKLPWSAVCTTNYDTLLDRCLNTRPAVNETDFADALRQPRDKRPTLFKLHGLLNDPHTLTARDYKNWAASHKAAHQFVANLLSSQTILFVGYSIGDQHWKALLDLMAEIVGDDQKWLFALLLDASPDEIGVLRDVHHINAASLTSMQYAEAFDQIAAAYRILGRVDGIPDMHF